MIFEMEFSIKLLYRGSSNGGVVKEPFVGPVMELFHENEVEDSENEVEDLVDEAEVSPESLTVSSGSSRSSRESGVESMMEMETGLDLEDNKEDIPDITVTEVEAGKESGQPRSRSSSGSKRTDSESVKNDIDSPFEKFSTVYV